MESAVKCTEMNSKIYGFGDKVKTRKMDLRDVYLNKLIFSHGVSNKDLSKHDEKFE